MKERERLIELLCSAPLGFKSFDSQYYKSTISKIADYLLDNGVIVTPCVAMVEQFIKDGKFDKKYKAHNGRIAVVYFDKSKWNSPLIDITEQFYNTGKAYERIEVLKGGEK